MKKERIDVLLVEQGFFDSREKAKRAIMAGLVYDEHDRIDKPGTKIPIDAKIGVKGNTLKYVSRGGLKLEKAINQFNISLQDKTMLDIGSSTGGFTDCALQNGAKFVYALDVGTNQLVWKLRNDPRVEAMEQTNFRYATKDMFKNGLPDFASIDVSFISLKLIFPPLKEILKPNGEFVALIKPQFEAGKEQVGKNGIIKDAKIHKEVIEKVLSYANENGFTLLNLSFSPITGGQGNIEFLGHFLNGQTENVLMIDIDDIVSQAHTTFAK